MFLRIQFRGVYFIHDFHFNINGLGSDIRYGLWPIFILNWKWIRCGYWNIQLCCKLIKYGNYWTGDNVISSVWYLKLNSKGTWSNNMVLNFNIVGMIYWIDILIWNCYTIFYNKVHLSTLYSIFIQILTTITLNYNLVVIDNKVLLCIFGICRWNLMLVSLLKYLNIKEIIDKQ